jgi:hypothetical protein
MKQGSIRPSVMIALFLLLTGSVAAPASAQDAPFLDGMPMEQFAAARDLQKAFEALDSSEQARAVFRTSVEWPPTYKKLRVCFFGGNQKLRATIAGMAKEWERPENSIRFDFGKTGKLRSCNPNGGKEMQIRISFDKNGFWSHLGTNGVVYVPQTDATMNFEKFADKPVDQMTDYERSAIRHEFGHALGLEHEHQNPHGHCEQEFNWARVYEWLEQQGWSKDYIDFAMREITGDDLDMTDFDRASIMLYYFPPDFYTKGEQSNCYISTFNEAISPVDLNKIAERYPSDPNARVERHKRNRAAFAAVWENAQDDVSRSAKIDPLAAFFDRPGNVNESDDDE